ncbi:hypothetical protein ES703_122357 [subsurface metagenome]
MKTIIWIGIIIGAIVLSLILGSQLFPREVVVESTYALTQCQNELKGIKTYNDARNPISKQLKTFITDLETNPTITSRISVLNICGSNTAGPTHLKDLYIKWLYDDTYAIEGECWYWSIFRG